MKLNNKGITLTEIIISIALISIVLIFLFSLLVTVNDINKESEVNSTYLVNKSLILKNIEDDLRKATSVSVSRCNINSIYSQYGVDKTNVEYFSYKGDENTIIEETKLKANFCLNFNYGTGDNGYLGIYYYKNRNSYVISYIHGNVKSTKLLPDFEKYNVDDSSGNFRHLFELNPNTLDSVIKGFFTLKIPIIGSDEKDYSIIISYYGK